MSAQQESQEIQVLQQKLEDVAKKTVPATWGLLLSVAKDFGIVVVLIWYLWFTQTTTIPNSQREFHDLISKEREAFRTELVEQRKHDERRSQEANKVNEARALDIVRAMSELTAEIRSLKRGVN